MNDEENLYFTEMSRLTGVTIELNILGQIQSDYDASSIAGDVPKFDYHLELSNMLIEGLPDPEDDDYKIIIKHLGNGIFEEITSHEKLTLATFLHDDPIWDKLGVKDEKLKHLDCKVYDTPDIIKEEIDYHRKNPIRIFAVDGLEAIKPISELSKEEYNKYSDVYRIVQIKEAREKALAFLEKSILEVIALDYEAAKSEEERTKYFR